MVLLSQLSDELQPSKVLKDGVHEVAYIDQRSGEVLLIQVLFKDWEMVKRVSKKFQSVQDYKQKVAVHNRTCSTEKCYC